MKRLGEIDLLTQVRAAVAFDESELITVRNCDWPLQRYGAMIVESSSEDAYWSAYAESGPAKGNIVWETESVSVAVLRVDDVVVSKQIVDALLKLLRYVPEHDDSCAYHDGHECSCQCAKDWAELRKAVSK